MMLGDLALAYLNKSLTLLAPTPTNISTKSDPLTKKNGTPASPAQAFATIVLPVPGGPASNAPLGNLAPISLYLRGFLRKSTNSLISSFASSNPATSLNLTLTFYSKPNYLTFDLPNPNTSFPPPLPIFPMDPLSDLNNESAITTVTPK